MARGGGDEAKRLSWLLQVARSRAKELQMGMAAGLKVHLPRGRQRDQGGAVQGVTTPCWCATVTQSRVEVVCEGRLVLAVNDMPAPACALFVAADCAASADACLL